jgi:hypothetical protein
VDLVLPAILAVAFGGALVSALLMLAAQTVESRDREGH